MRVLISIYSDLPTWNIPASEVDRVRREFPHLTVLHARSAAETLSLVRDADVAFSSLIRREALAAARRLKWIHSPAAGVGSMLFPEMQESPVVLTNARGMHANAIAEHVIGVVIALFRKMREAFAHQSAHRWGHAAMSGGAPLRLVRGSVLGVIGPGAIGSTVAQLASAMGATVEAIRRRPELGAPDGVHAVYGPASLLERLPHWDVVVLAAPLTAETKGLIAARELEAMKRDAVLVNVGRGKLVNEADLARALGSGLIGGAALDVVEHEPLDPASPLWDLPNALITPHISGLWADYWTSATDLFIENLRRYDSGRPLLNVVDKKSGY
jgi:phosphoglycerate dehydrogenase-like enzyme